MCEQFAHRDETPIRSGPPSSAPCRVMRTVTPDAERGRAQRGRAQRGRSTELNPMREVCDPSASIAVDLRQPDHTRNGAAVVHRLALSPAADSVGGECAVAVPLRAIGMDHVLPPAQRFDGDAVMQRATGRTPEAGRLHRLQLKEPGSRLGGITLVETLRSIHQPDGSGDEQHEQERRMVTRRTLGKRIVRTRRRGLR